MLVISAEKSLPIVISQKGRERKDGACRRGDAFLERGSFLIEIFVFIADKSYPSFQVIFECQRRS